VPLRRSVLHFPLSAQFLEMRGVNTKTRYCLVFPSDRTDRARDANPLCPPELREFRNKLHAMNSSAACIMCFHISNARPSWLRNARACSRLTGQPCSFPDA
jgi:hypothetical protein